MHTRMLTVMIAMHTMMMMAKWELRLRTLPAGHHPRLSLLQTSPKCWGSSSPWSLADGFDHNDNHIMGKIFSSNLINIDAIESHSHTHNCNWTICAQAATLECSRWGHRPHSYQAQIWIHTFPIHLQTLRHKHRSTDKAPEKPINSCSGRDLIWNLMTTSVHFVIFQPLLDQAAARNQLLLG